MRDKHTIVEGVEYKVVDESYEDDYGSLRSNYVPYKKIEGKWNRLSPETYGLDSWSAEGYIPQYEQCCKTCGHKTRIPINWL